MSILILGMEMPTSCKACEILTPCSECEGYSDYCGIMGRLGCWVKNTPDGWKHPDCPLVEVPPHGDLIDRGYAIATACSGLIRTLPTTEGGENWIRVAEVRESIKSAPTIIEAEEGE